MDAPLTQLLNDSLAGNDAAAARAWSVVYPRVRDIAAAALRGESTAQSALGDLHPTGLVSEVFMRIGRSPPIRWDSRKHFFGAVSHACRQQLIDLARVRKALKRGGGEAPVPLTFVARSLPDRAAQAASSDERLDLSGALSALSREYPRAAEVSRLRYMESCDVALISEIVGVSLSTVEKDLAFARAWLRRWIERGG
ncbi:MAG: hypothetical protein KGR22_11035 [Planctomycetes bacterium]|nr:hypothetical protein [Planctomycetota bacterium]